ncbi:MAG: lipase maturation factor family protein, partial [Myxococcota bacterium]|nr:lipase maturation factor family protein [Myxococcota bacterium]
MVGGVFMRYQWDMLLLESLFVSLFICPWSLSPRVKPERRPPWSGLWLGRLLLLKLMVLSGSVKILSEDPTWADLSALNYHYWTQPIPAWSSWFVHHLGSDFHQLSVMAMYVGEILLPFTMFGPRRLRLLGFWGMLGLLLGMGFTGNYGYFHTLTAALLLLVVDDQHLRGLVPARWRTSLPDPHEHARAPTRRGLRALVGGLAVYVAILSSFQMAQRYDRSLEVPGWVAVALEPANSLRVINGYGLFATMTTTRPEVIIEGSSDGEVWEAYDFPYKAGALEVAPSFAPLLHMPRVDWQLWFAALRGNCQNTRWYLPFARRLLEGSQEVRGLLAHDPFPDEPPRHLRSRLF